MFLSLRIVHSKIPGFIGIPFSDTQASYSTCFLISSSHHFHPLSPHFHFSTQLSQIRGDVDMFHSFSSTFQCFLIHFHQIRGAKRLPAVRRAPRLAAALLLRRRAPRRRRHRGRGVSRRDPAGGASCGLGSAVVGRAFGADGTGCCGRFHGAF